MLDTTPRFTPALAAAVAREQFGLDATARALPSERDQNFLLETAACERLVLKIANAREERALLEAQQQAMAVVGKTSTAVPRVVATARGDTLAEAMGPDGRRHLVWAVTHLPGAPLGTLRRRTPALWERFGREIGLLGAALDGFDHPALHRELPWDLARGRRVVAEHRRLIDDPGLGAAIDTLVERFDRHTAPRLAGLRRGVVHNDLNDYNVLVGGGESLHDRNQRVVGIVDFGDMLHSFAVSDLAIASAYAALGADDPLAVAATLVRGHHAVRPVGEEELSALFGLMTLRLCVSAVMAAHQQRERPEDPYLRISQAGVRGTLPRLARVPFGKAEAVLRDACGLEPCASSARVRSWLRARQNEIAPVLPVDLRTTPCTVLDLGVASHLVSGDPRENAEPHLTRRVFEHIHAAGTRIGIGRYDEPRLLYVAPAFGADTPGAERRMLHIGLDLFAEVGTPVHAPLEGVVHAFADNHAPLDYGPVIILRHATDDGTEFFTLYGHLSRESLRGLEVGRPVARGERIAWLGAPDENVGWTPHLHLQIIVDLLELGTDFPGVGRVSERAVWRSLSPDPNLLVGIPEERFPPAVPDKARTLARRRSRVGRNVSVAYRDPLRIVRGWRQYLYDDEGRRYLDAYNNVPHVGHCHPRVVRAGQTQMAVLNTNTRYLSDTLDEYAERLSATLPEPLRVCYFLNSASEANELALRLVRAHTGRRDMIVLDAAYHGHTTGLIDLSPYKHAGPGGSGAPEWVHVAPLPDDYRGPFRRDDPDAGRKYAGQVGSLVDALRERGRDVAGFIAETCPSVGGQLVLPPGYLAGVYHRVRAAGGLCIADEVQTGLGRLGTHFWAFESHGVVPDIVVMGKPLGNGHPMAAVVTTAEIAASFANGMEFFSTFGGNNVSCAIGLAVLDVLRDEGLQAHALRVGAHMLDGLRPLVDRFPLVGDVRGAGLFLGVELVRDRATLTPASDEASYVVNRMREEGILVGTDGPHHNVLKIRPPMPFDESDADLLLATLARLLEDELGS